MAAGVDALTAAFEAGSSRFRPVLMTALAMIIGMLPMAIEPGQNAPLGPRRDRRPDLRHLRHPVSGADHFQPGAPPGPG